MLRISLNDQNGFIYKSTFQMSSLINNDHELFDYDLFWVDFVEEFIIEYLYRDKLKTTSIDLIGHN